VKSNLDMWKELQSRDYFGTHPCYKRADGTLNTDAEDDAIIERFLPLGTKRNVAVLGCGFGRESAVIAPKVGHVWGVDVSRDILDKAVDFLAGRGVRNFTPVLAERWKQDLPGGLDLVYSFIVFQHITRDLVRDYVLNLPAKLAPGGEMLCQFANLSYGTPDAETQSPPHEPSVRWSRADIEALVAEAGMEMRRIEAQAIPGHGEWIWAHFGLREP